jgi:hypothetical protein
MDRAHGCDTITYTAFWLENWKGRDDFGDISLDNIKWILKK